MSDSFTGFARTPTDPAHIAYDIIPDDLADLPHVTVALNVEAPGKVRVTTLDGTISSVSIHPGHAFPIRVRRVWQTGTTATGITGLA